MKEKLRKEYPYDPKTMFGMSVNGLVGIAGAALASQMFMVYLTDYSGIGPLGAVLATTVLFVGRIFDAVNDPIQSWIMDSYKGGKYGKYKPFIILGIALMSISLIFLYNLPSSFAGNAVIAGIWVFLFYFMYDVGTSFQPFIPLLRSLTDDEVLRSKFLKNNRIVTVCAAIPMGLVMTAALAFNEQLGGIKTAIGLFTAVSILVIAGISFFGIACVKEGRHEQEKEEKVRFHDIINMFKHNKAMTVLAFSSIFSGFIYPLSTAVAAYFIKWSYCVDLSTGVVDNDRLAMLMLIFQMMAILPVILAAAFSPMLVKRFGSNLKAQLFSFVLSFVPYTLMTVFQLFGILTLPMFIALFFTASLFSNLGYVPGMGLWTECIDYNRYKAGKEMGALVLTVRGLLEKGQTAIAGALTGMILIAVGYSVNADTGDYLGNLSDIPRILNSFGIMMGIVPAVLAIITLFVLKKLYPIDDKVRAEMREHYGT